MKKIKTKAKTIIVSSSDSYFDDCPICQAMKKAEEKGKDLSEKELLAAFEEAKSKGAVTGNTLSNPRSLNSGVLGDQG